MDQYTPPTRAEIGTMSLDEASAHLARAASALHDLETWRVEGRDQIRQLRESIVSTNEEREALIDAVARLQKMVNVRTGESQRVRPQPATLNAAGV